MNLWQQYQLFDELQGKVEKNNTCYSRNWIPNSILGRGVNKKLVLVNYLSSI